MTDSVERRASSGARRERILRGLPVSPGIVLGSTFVYGNGMPEIPERDLHPDEVPAELERFEQALLATRQDLLELKAKIEKQAGPDFAEFIDLLLLLLNESEALDGTRAVIRTRRKNAEFAYTEVVRHITAPLRESDIAFVKEKAADMADVTQRVIHRLMGKPKPTIYDAPAGAVVIADDLPPSEATLLDRRRVGAVAISAGGKTSHTAIMMRTKEIPCLVGVENLCRKVVSGMPAILDGYRGVLILAPSPRRLEFYKQEQARLERRRTVLFRHLEDEPITLDGKHIDLMANIEFLSEVEPARAYGARGIGLFRSEFLVIARRRPPTEEEQVQAFSAIARKIKPYPVVIRTFDMGGDKILPGYTEANPFLGWRAIRFCIDNRDFFRTHLRAILRSSTSGNVRMMIPMISSLEELRRVKLLLSEARQELRKENVPFDEHLPLGIMVEIPSAALLADSFARECGFFSIGSNDLTQYTLAVDRGNKKVAKLYDHFHPAILRLAKNAIDAARRNEISVGLCGEMASDPLGIVLLVGLGIDELSMIPSALPQAISVIRTIDRAHAREIADKALTLATPLEVTNLLRREIDRRFPALAALLLQNLVTPDRAPRAHEDSPISYV